MKISTEMVKEQLSKAIEAGKEDQRMLHDLLSCCFIADIDEDLFYRIVDWRYVTNEYVKSLQSILDTFNQGHWAN